MTPKFANFQNWESVSEAHKTVRSAFSLVEVLVVVGMIAIFMVLFFPNISQTYMKAEGVACTARLRNLWTVFATYVNDGNSWPQVPAETAIGSSAEQQWWLDFSSNSMGLKKQNWICPATIRMAHNSSNPPVISYLPTLFDSNQMTPMKWARMPWFTEISEAHGNGNLSIRADGSVSPIQDP